MTRKRYYIALVEEPEAALPVRYRERPRWRPPPTPPPDPLIALLEALAAISRRGEGPEAWALPLESNPLAFVLDALADGVLIRTESGRVLFRNRAAAALGDLGPTRELYQRVSVGKRRYIRRSMRYTTQQGDLGALIVEVISND